MSLIPRNKGKKVHHAYKHNGASCNFCEMINLGVIIPELISVEHNSAPSSGVYISTNS